MSAAEIIAWLRSPEGEEWSRNQPERRFYEDTYPGEMTQQGPGNADEDPTGRPPIAGKGAARDGEVA
jgi:hypothetical protein